MSNIQRFGSYFLLKKIATGGMAELYKAKKSGEKGFEKLLAIKMILPHLSANEEFISMFIDEAKVAALLNHQNIVQIYDLGKIENSYCIVMEYVRGKDLKSTLSRGVKSKSRIGVEHACLVTASALAGLSYAHRKRDKGRDLKIVHRDISPQNILITYEGEIKIVDFGIAKAATQSRDTKVGVLKGKIAYMSPEQAMGKPLDRRSDVFSMGVVLYEMLAGKKLFQGDTDLNTLEQVRTARVEPLPHELNAEVPKDLEDILLKALAKEPDERFQSASEMEEALQQFMRKAGYSTGGYSLSQYMSRLFKDDIEEELREEEEWDQTMVSEALSADTLATSLKDQTAVPEKPAPQPAPQPVQVTGRDIADKKEAPLLTKVLAAVIAVAALAGIGVWMKSRPAPAPQAQATTEAKGDTSAQTPPAPAEPAHAKPEKAVKAPPAERHAAKAGQEAPAAKSEPAPPARASVTITSDPPGAEASIDGRAAGVTPAESVDVGPGQTHRVRVAKAGYDAWNGSFSAGPGETASVHAELKEKSCSLSVNSNPAGAKILLDGQDTGRKTPASLDGLKPGKTYKVRLVIDGYGLFEDSVVADPSRTVSVNGTLVQQFGALTVDSQPWAVVVVDGEEKGTTPIAGLKLAVGEHSLALGNPKLKLGKRMKVRIEPNKTTRIVVDLNKAPQ